MFNFQKLDSYIVARQFAQLVHQAGIADPELRDQVTRAAKSVFLNISEGLPDHRTGIRRRHFEAARNSLAEAVAGIDLATVLNALQPARSEALLAVAYRLAPIIGGLLKRK